MRTTYPRFMKQRRNFTRQGGMVVFKCECAQRKFYTCV